MTSRITVYVTCPVHERVLAIPAMTIIRLCGDVALVSTYCLKCRELVENRVPATLLTPTPGEFEASGYKVITLGVLTPVWVEEESARLHHPAFRDLAGVAAGGYRKEAGRE